MSAQSKVKWSIEADYIQGCNCDYGCPCEFAAPPTLGNCQGVGIWRINKGRYGSVSLDSLGIAFAAYWPKAIHEGNGTIALFVDELANSQQRDGLLQIMTGQAGGLPFEILATTFSKVLDPFYVPFEIKTAGRNSSAKVGNYITLAVAPIKNPVTGDPETVRIEHETGFVFKGADCVSAEEMRVNVGELNFSWPKKAGFVAKISYAN